MISTEPISYFSRNGHPADKQGLTYFVIDEFFDPWKFPGNPIPRKGPNI